MYQKLSLVPFCRLWQPILPLHLCNLSVADCNLQSAPAAASQVQKKKLWAVQPELKEAP